MEPVSKYIIISAPSGAGKTTIVRLLMQQPLHLEFSVSACSRNKRGKEKNGIDYWFLPVEEFRKRIENNEFIEWQEVYNGMYYGTLRIELERIRKNGNHAIFDVDVKGGLNLKKIFGDQALSIFIMPPSMEELKRRLIDRSDDPADIIQQRVDKAMYELSFANQFDKIVINDKIETAFKEILELVSNFLSLSIIV
ncbi:MAG: guanylate kinase [Bacteroidia bacterium]|nr:guanylate kinase [Bacteroidia bacterium]